MTFTATAAPSEGDERPDDAIQAAFEKFDREHPDVWALFVRFAEDLRAAGRRYYSADALLHRIRWHYDTTAHHGASVPKLNNNMSSRYARKLAATRPEFAGFFRTRKLASERDESVGGAA